MQEEKGNGHKDLDELVELIEELTTTGEKSLDEKNLKALKRLCKKSQENVAHVHRLITTQLEKEHSEIRLSAFQIIDEIFCRSHLFRKLITDNFACLLEVTVESKLEMKLPPPIKAAKALKVLALARIDAWHNQFGKDYKRLELGYNFLKRVKKIDFAGVRSQTELERRRQEELQSRQHQLEIRALEKVDREMKILVFEIESTLTQANSCLNLLFPKPDQQHDNEMLDSAVPKENSSKKSSVNQENVGVNHGIISRAYSISIKVPLDKMHVTETEDNIDLLRNLKDLMNQIKIKFLPIVSKWVNILSKSANVKQPLEKSLKLKNDLKEIMEKYREIDIDTIKKNIADEIENESDSGSESFEDVPENYVEDDSEFSSTIKMAEDKQTHCNVGELPRCSKDSAKDLQMRKLARAPVLPFDDVGETPGCSKDSEEDLQRRKLARAPVVPFDDVGETPGCSKDSAEDLQRRKLLAKAPIVPFDNDLKYWGQKQMHVSPVIKNDSLHRFWHHTEFDEEFIPAGLEESLRNRSMEFSGEFQSVKWNCRVPLPNGKLCTRQDRLKCPFHGKIIARDEIGNPSNREDEDLERERKRKIQEKESKEIQRDIELATGADLGASVDPKKKRRKKVNNGKGKGKRYCRLTSLKEMKNNSRKRLETKVLTPGALARVNDSLNAMDSRRSLEQFGSQFNYYY